jgi:putative lipoic acid-binding regulatory protein
LAERTDGRVPIEELIEFPARYSFKAIGHHTRDFSDRAYAALKACLADGRKVEFRTRMSRQGTYLSVTLTTQIESADELKTAYAALRKIEGVITLL